MPGICQSHGQHKVAFAAGTFWCRATARWIAEEGLSLDACSEGELPVARAAGFPAGRILFDGYAKTASELSAALDYGVGRVVTTSPSDVAQLAALAGRRQKVLVGGTAEQRDRAGMRGARHAGPGPHRRSR